MRRVNRALLALALLALSACPAGAPARVAAARAAAEAAALTDEPSGKACATDLDCGAEESCRQGHCGAFVEYGAPCGGESDCRTGVCEGGRCSCGPGDRYVARRGCVSEDWCSGDGDCSRPPDACHRGAGTCAGSVACVYPPLACPTGQACAGGECRPSPLRFTVEATGSPTERWSASSEGPPRFRATLANLSDQPVTVAAVDAGPIEVALARDGQAVRPDAQPARFHSSPSGAQLASLVTLQPGGQASFAIASPNWLNAFVGQVLAVAAWPCAPGKYRATFYYRYAGPDAGKANVWRGLVAADPVEFTVE
jgi:hypothetical protein